MRKIVIVKLRLMIVMLVTMTCVSVDIYAVYLTVCRWER